MNKMTKQATAIEDILCSVMHVMSHIKEVQNDIATLTTQSSEELVNYIQKQEPTIAPEVLHAMQLQDIITQQYSAITEAIESIERSLDIHLHAAREDNVILRESFAKLHAKMIASLEKARKKQDSFAGHSFESNTEEQEAEFF
jgi:histidine ammonia-lyase